MKEWVKIIINALKEHEISVISYIPDISIDNITKEIESNVAELIMLGIFTTVLISSL